jgi:thiol:disulfide interchange protein DsbC
MKNISFFILLDQLKRSRFKIIVLTDVTCPYSLALHREIEWLSAEGVEIRYLPLPSGDEESLSFKKMHAVWCNQDRQSAFEKAIQNQRFRLEDCQTFALSAGNALGNVLNVKGTPTLLFEDGTISTGYSSAVEILDYLEKGTPLETDSYSAKE